MLRGGTKIIKKKKNQLKEKKIKNWKEKEANLISKWNWLWLIWRL
jgi:hypothetical protein